MKSALAGPTKWFLLFHKAIRQKRWVCAVTKRRQTEGFLITAYPTDAIKEGTSLWKK